MNGHFRHRNPNESEYEEIGPPKHRGGESLAYSAAKEKPRKMDVHAPLAPESWTVLKAPAARYCYGSIEICFYGMYFFRAIKFFNVDCTVVRNT
jgi:hypothetical protein